MSEQKADKIQLEAMKLVSCLSHHTDIICFSQASTIIDEYLVLIVKVPTGFTTATEMHLKRSQIIQVLSVGVKSSASLN